MSARRKCGRVSGAVVEGAAASGLPRGAVSCSPALRSAVASDTSVRRAGRTPPHCGSPRASTSALSRNRSPGAWRAAARCLRRWGGVGLTASLLGCGGADLEGAPDEGVVAGPGTSDGEDDASADAIVFDVGRELRLTAGTERTLTLRVSPPGEHAVRLALVGDGRGAFLSEALVRTDANGEATFVLTVTAADSEFSVRAAVGGTQSELRVVTLPAETATLTITPYYAGDRELANWVASVHLGARCEELEGTPPPDGQAAVQAAGSGPIVLTGVPAGRALAAVVRSSQLAGGCHDVEPIRAGTQANVSVEILDRPMQVRDVSLRLELGLLTQSPDLLPALDELVYRTVAPMVAGLSDDLEAVLQAMAAAAAPPEAFEAARQSNNWRTLLVQNLDPGLAGTGLRSTARGWMQDGLDRLAEPDAIVGTLTSGTSGSVAVLALESFGGLLPAAAGFEPEHPAAVAAESNDFLRIGTSLDWEPRAFLVNIAALEAAGDFPGATPPEALALTFGCEEVADLLVPGTGGGEAFAGCDEACVQGLCEQAMETLWSRVERASVPTALWDISAAARATLDGQARPAQIQGSWAGTLDVSGFGDAPMGGPLSGTPPLELSE